MSSWHAQQLKFAFGIGSLMTFYGVIGFLTFTVGPRLGLHLNTQIMVIVVLLLTLPFTLLIGYVAMRRSKKKEEEAKKRRKRRRKKKPKAMAKRRKSPNRPELIRICRPVPKRSLNSCRLRILAERTARKPFTRCRGTSSPERRTSRSTT